MGQALSFFLLSLGLILTSSGSAPSTPDAWPSKLDALIQTLDLESTIKTGEQLALSIDVPATNSSSTSLALHLALALKRAGHETPYPQIDASDSPTQAKKAGAEWLLHVKSTPAAGGKLQLRAQLTRIDRGFWESQPNAKLFAEAKQTIASLRNFGGRAQVLLHTRGVPQRPDSATNAAESVILTSVYETLYTLKNDGTVVPNLATERPLYTEGEVKILIRSDILRHDGKVLSAEDVAASLRRLAPETKSMHLFPIEAVAAEPGDAPAIRLKLKWPYPALAKLLCHPKTAIAGPGRTPKWGTGPWKVSQATDQALRLQAFSSYRNGRPYLGQIDVRAERSRTRAIASIRQNQAQLALGFSPSVPSGSPQKVAPEPSALLFLVLGPQFEAQQTQISENINRGRLTQKYLPQGSQIRTTLLTSSPLQPSKRPNTRKKIATLWVPRPSPLSRRFLKRLQLDLLRSGIVAKIESKNTSFINSRMKKGQFDLILTRHHLPSWSQSEPWGRLHLLIELATKQGLWGSLAQDFASSAGQRSSISHDTLRTFDKKLRQTAHLVPIASIVTGVNISSNFHGLDLTLDGPNSLKNTFVTPDSL